MASGLTLDVPVDDTASVHVVQPDEDLGEEPRDHPLGERAVALEEPGDRAARHPLREDVEGAEGARDPEQGHHVRVTPEEGQDGDLRLGLLEGQTVGLHGVPGCENYAYVI